MDIEFRRKQIWIEQGLNPDTYSNAVGQAMNAYAEEYYESKVNELNKVDVNSVERKFCPFCKKEVSRMHISCQNCDAHLIPD